jgi:hypothetical protein
MGTHLTRCSLLSALCCAAFWRCSYIAVHTNASPADADDDAASAGVGASYLRPTSVPTGGVLRIALDARSGRFAGRSSWAVAPQAGLLNRPSGIAFSRDGTRAYVATFLPGCADAQGGIEQQPQQQRRHARGVMAFCGPASATPWTRLPGFDERTAPAPPHGLHPWGLAVRQDAARGALLLTAHGGAGGHAVAELCGGSGRVLRVWRHDALNDAAPNSLALL